RHGDDLCGSVDRSCSLTLQSAEEMMAWRRSPQNFVTASSHFAAPTRPTKVSIGNIIWRAGMDFFRNDNPTFTKWLGQAGLPREPFVLIDVGVLGGENPRWQVLGDHLVVHGFDAIKEAVDELAGKNRARNKTFHALAIGDEDGEREFYFKPGNPSNSSF